MKKEILNIEKYQYFFPLEEIKYRLGLEGETIFRISRHTTQDGEKGIYIETRTIKAL